MTTQQDYDTVVKTIEHLSDLTRNGVAVVCHPSGVEHRWQVTATSRDWKGNPHILEALGDELQATLQDLLRLAVEHAEAEHKRAVNVQAGASEWLGNLDVLKASL